MAKRYDVYKCPDCGLKFEALGCCDCDCELKCGDAVLEQVEANTVDAAVEKHVPVVEKTETGCTVKVGSVAHPMTEEHYIEWIEVIAGNRVTRVYLKPGEEPQADFVAGTCQCCCSSVKVREYCNLHGLWEATVG